MDLQAFAQKLRDLRKKIGLTQQELATQIFVSVHLFSNWERAYQHQGRSWQPDRHSVVCLIKLFVNYFSPAEAQTWAAWAGHSLSLPELQEIFGAIPRQASPLPPFYINRRALEQTLLSQLSNGRPPVLALVGMGGVGKSTLAAWLAQNLTEQFPDGVIWVNHQAVNNLTRAQDWIAHSLGVVLNENSPAERAGMLRSLLYEKRLLLVLDDVWAESELAHLQVTYPPSLLLITTRDAKVADILNAPRVQVPNLSQQESSALLTAWKGQPLAADELIIRLGGHPLALNLSGAQLRAGIKLSNLMAAVQAKQIDLGVLDMDDPQDRAESLTYCFDLSYERLSPLIQQRFAQLSCFANSFETAPAIAVWNVDPTEGTTTLRRLTRLALLQEKTDRYDLHPLLQAYTSQKLSIWPDTVQTTRRRHAAWHIRYALYHPRVLDDVTDPAPDLEQTWADIIMAVKWALFHEPMLATAAALLAYTERPALLNEVGSGLITAVIDHLAQTNPETERAILCELLGDLCLLNGDVTSSLSHFDQANEFWAMTKHWLASSRAKLRMAGAYLLLQDQASAATAAREAQTRLEQSLPINPADLETARWLFYWFDMIYNPLTRWVDLAETDVACLADLAHRTNYPMLEARGLHIYRLWYTADAPRLSSMGTKGCQLALQAYRLWRACGRMDRADDEISWTNYRLTGHYSQRAAARFAQRRSQTTPALSSTQIQLVKSEGMRWWLGAAESERVAWLSHMLPRYLTASNSSASPLPRDSQEWCLVDDILNIGMMGHEARRLGMINHLPTDHILTGPEWYVLSGQKALPLVGPAAIQLVTRYLAGLESQLNKA